MRDLSYLDKYRIPLLGDMGDKHNGAFNIRYRGRDFKVIASDGLGWEHVSISAIQHTPNWDEMCHFKDLFFHDDEIVIQVHPAKKDYVNIHEHCLHLWKPTEQELPLPRKIMV